MRVSTNYITSPATILLIDLFFLAFQQSPTRNRYSLNETNEEKSWRNKKTAETKAKLANGSSLSISLFIPLLHATINYYHFIYMRIVCN